MNKKIAKILSLGLLFVLAIAGLTIQGKARSQALTLQTLPGGTLDPTIIPKFVTPLVIPPAMPRSGIIWAKGKNVDYYEIAVRQFQQQILPIGFPVTTVWGYGSIRYPKTFNYPAFTIEARYGKPVRVKWINGLVDANGNYLPHLLPVDQTLHWANPLGGLAGRDGHSMDPTPYTGPVPMVTHVHGAHTDDESDGFAEAWYLPAAKNLPAGIATTGSWFKTFRQQFAAKWLVNWTPGTATFQYPNDQRASTLWYHDHTLGMTRLNVYAGPAGFYLLRGGPADLGLGYRSPMPGDPALNAAGIFPFYSEIPIAIQDRSFNADGSLFYPSNRSFFEGLSQPPTVPFLDIPFHPAPGCDGMPSDVAPIWNPEFFGNTMVVNGKTWPYFDVKQRRYRLRFLNGCNARFLILKMDNDLPFWQIGAEGGFLPAPVQLSRLLMSPAERADVIVDFTGIPKGTVITLLNLGPDEPFGGGEPDVDFDSADPNTTGVVMQFRVGSAKPDASKPPSQITLPVRTPLGPETVTRQITLNEMMSMNVKASMDGSGNIVSDCANGEFFGPTAAVLGTLNADGTSQPLMWVDPISENPALGATEVWEIHNFTVDAHPIHLHEVMFEVVNREAFDSISPYYGQPARQPEAWETGVKDTVIAYPGEITRVKARFDIPGLFVWHCHIVEHEDNEMMRPYAVGPVPVKK
jgi:bilirubin oxidase